MKHTFLAIMLFAFAATSFGQQVGFELGIGRYEMDDFNNASIRTGINYKLNNYFGLELNATIFTKDEEERILFSDFPPFETLMYTEEHEGYKLELMLDMHLFSLANNKLQTHVKVGGGFYNLSNSYLTSALSGVIEERVMLSKNLSAALGFDFSYDLYRENLYDQVYFSVRRTM